MLLAKRLLVVLAPLVLTLPSSCRTTSFFADSDVKGLAAVSSATNVAVLITASGHTPENGPNFEQDMNNFFGMLADPAGNWRFKTAADREANHGSMTDAIAKGAAAVCADGTLLILIAAHGDKSGKI